MEAILCRHCGNGVSAAHFRKCAACAEMIRRDAVLCRFCRTAVAADSNVTSGVARPEPTEADSKTALELQYGVNYLSLEMTAVWPQCLAQLPEEDIRRYQAVPVRRVRNRLLIAMVNPNDMTSCDAIKARTGSTIQPAVCTQKSFDWFMANKYAALLAEAEDADDATDTADAPVETDTPRGRPKQVRPVTHDAPIVLLANMIINHGIKCGVMEVRVEPNGEEVKVFHVIRGKSKVVRTLPAAVGVSLTARFKAMAGMDAAHKPQRGATEVIVAETAYRVAIETKQSTFGEVVVLQPRQAS